MPISRLGIANPSANTDTVLAGFDAEYLVSVVVANKAVVATPITRVSIWVVPANATIEAQYAYIAFNLQLGVGSSFETFRFGVVDGDTIYVRASTDNTSFSLNGILQDDAQLARNISETFTNKTIRGTENTLYLDKGDTADRPGSVESGYTRFNTETDTLEVYTTEGLWEVVGTGESGSGATGPAGPTGPNGDSLNIRGRVFDSTYLPQSTDNTTFTVTVESTLEGNKYYINGELHPDLYLAPGGTYIFDQSDASNSTHQLYLSETSNGHHALGGTVGEAEYTDGITYTGTAGIDGQLTFVIPASAEGDGGDDSLSATPNTLYYVCVNHSGMSGDSEISVLDNANNDAFIATDTGNLHIWDGTVWGDVGRFVGPTGATGATGPTGADGADGAIGPTGPTGADSTVAGPTGATGATGPQGTSINLLGSVPTVGDLPSLGNEVNDAYIVDADGNLYVWDGSAWYDVGLIQGPTGPTGADGTNGADGVDGADGADGAIGPTGPTGADGVDGADGAIGPTGPTGAQGTSINLLGTVATVPELPATGNTENDAYVVEADGEVYVWDGLNWNSVGALQGPTGATGATGATGPAGSGLVDVQTTTDTTTFVGLYEDASGAIGGKTNTGIIYNATTEKLTVTNIETESIQAPSALTGTYSIVSPTTITLDATDEILNNAPIRLVNKTTAELGSLVASVGSVVYNTDDDLAYYYDGASWNSLQGPTGTAATVAAGTVGTLSPDLPASVTNVGTSSAAIFNFGIPQGATGPAGPSINAIAKLDVVSNDSTSYRFVSHYGTSDNPTVYAIGGATLAFDLTNVSASHPFLIQEDSGGGFANITTGIIHVADNGTVTEGSGAQGQTSGTVYWEVPITSASTWRYICSVHSNMVGTLTIKSLTTI